MSNDADDLDDIVKKMRSDGCRYLIERNEKEEETNRTPYCVRCDEEVHLARGDLYDHTGLCDECAQVVVSDLAEAYTKVHSDLRLVIDAIEKAFGSNPNQTIGAVVVGLRQSEQYNKALIRMIMGKTP